MATSGPFGLIMSNIMRDLVLLIGEFDINTKPFEERNLYTKKVKIDEAKPHFNNTRAIIVADFPNKFGLINECFKKLISEAENYGIVQIILFHNDSDFSQ